MKSFACLALLLLSAVCALAAEKDAVVPLSREPHHHMIFQNEYTRVWDVNVAPNESTLMHQHDNDYVAVILTPSHVENAVEGRPVTTGRAGVGEVRFTTAPMTHRLTDMGDQPFRNLIIEILKKNAGKSGEQKAERGLEVGHGGLSDMVIDNDQVRVQDVQIAGGGMLHKHTHKFPFLVVALTDLELHNMPEGKPAKMVSQKAGGVKWIGAGTTHEMMNMAKQEARFIEVEFK
jgi:quercetin dioxygenase-like cupin family protein